LREKREESPQRGFEGKKLTKRKPNGKGGPPQKERGHSGGLEEKASVEGKW